MVVYVTTIKSTEKNFEGDEIRRCEIFFTSKEYQPTADPWGWNIDPTFVKALKFAKGNLRTENIECTKTPYEGITGVFYFFWETHKNVGELGNFQWFGKTHITSVV